MRFAISERGDVASFYNKMTRHEYVSSPGQLWKLIYARGERQEIPVFSSGQEFSASTRAGKGGDEALTLVYPSLVSDEGRIALRLQLDFAMSKDRLSVVSSLSCEEQGIQVMELGITAASGIASLSGSPEEDSLALPTSLGRRLRSPAISDLSRLMGFRKYERRDELHTDIDLLYPSENASMQWYELYNEAEGLYVASHDEAASSTCLHIERDVAANELRLGVIRYPFLKKGERWTSKPLVYAAHAGDWHEGAKIYRAWMESVGWAPPQNPDWIRRWKGWLRVILKQHHGEVNWDFAQVPGLFEEAKAAGFDTIFLLGWERGGFARLWPDYVVDERMGGEAGLRDAIVAVHAAGGKVVMFLSYYLIDRQSEFYRNEGGDRVTMKSLWGQEIPFAETYCGEGSWRKIANPPMPMYAACPSCPEWQEKLEFSARYLTGLGADGVLFDIGAYTPYFCFAEDHPHAKPSEAVVAKQASYRALRDVVREAGPDRAIFMEHNVDIYASSMDISHSIYVRMDGDGLPEMYRYAFPEAIMTDRELHQDEEDYRRKTNFSFVYGLRLDMTIYRCCGTLSDVPRAAAYAKAINALRDEHAEHLLRGRFIDREGFFIDEPAIRAKSYRAEDGSVAVAAWNDSASAVDFALKDGAGRTALHRLEAGEVAVYVLDEKGGEK